MKRSIPILFAVLIILSGCFLQEKSNEERTASAVSMHGTNEKVAVALVAKQLNLYYYKDTDTYRGGDYFFDVSLVTGEVNENNEIEVKICPAYHPISVLSRCYVDIKKEAVRIGPKEATTVKPGYETVQTTYKKNKIVINYPQLVYMTDRRQQEEINALIKKYAIEGAKIFYGDDFEKSVIQIDYRIIHNSPSLLSIEYKGVGSRDGAYPNNLLYTTNIDMKTGKVLKLTDMVRIDDAFIRVLKSNKTQPVTTDTELTAAHRDLFQGVSNEQLKEYLLTTDSFDGSMVYSGLTHDTLRFTLPAIHALGDYAQYTIPLKEIKDYFKISLS
ncbi:MAG: hypothetical protein BGN88_07760 [Clostridiales bacterium 43-6]|nr:MAG: hypothetical protein BGN88_07760 [Clostridiales bacterium 43-6]